MRTEFIEFTDVLEDQFQHILTGMPIWKPTENQSAKHPMNTPLRDNDK